MSTKDTVLVRLGWVFAFLMPLVGFFVGVAAAIRGHARQGAGIMVAAVLVTVIAGSMVISSVAHSVDGSLAGGRTQVEHTTTPPSARATHSEP